MKYRVQVPGSNSVYVNSYTQALEVAAQVMELNGFGYIYTLRDGPSQLVARFEPYYGVVSA